MHDSQAPRHCPACGSVEVPTLIVRGSGSAADGVSLRCRACDREWSETRADRLRAS
jgi:formate dehydrogenase maturation protein FdhE